MRTFIEQDRDVVDKQQQGLNEDPQLILINDADKPARWYHQLKKELKQSRARASPVQQSGPHDNVAVVQLNERIVLRTR